jgi:hypothetical protein
VRAADGVVINAVLYRDGVNVTEQVLGGTVSRFADYDR